MNETKKKVFLKVAGIMAILMILATCFISGTLAKYTSSGNATVDSVTAAKWEIKANGDAFNASLGSLTWKIYDAESTNEVDTSTVAENKIAPGTWGYATINIQNAGEVKATLTANLSLPSSSSANLTFGYTYTTDSAADLTAMKAGTDATSAAIPLDQGETVYLYVYYEWKYEADGVDANANDVTDTAIGTAATEFTFNAGTLTITATQVEPTAKS